MSKKSISNWLRKIASKLDPRKPVFYQVDHLYDVDGGFGDAIPSCKPIAYFENENDAKAFVELYQKPHVYEIPYAELECGKLEIKKVDNIYPENFDVSTIDTEHFWWLTSEYPY